MPMQLSPSRDAIFTLPFEFYGIDSFAARVIIQVATYPLGGRREKVVEDARIWPDSDNWCWHGRIGVW